MQAQGHGGGGTFWGRAPPKRGLCPEEINTLGATAAQVEAQDSQIGAYRSRIRDKELFFCSFCRLAPDFMKLGNEDLFFFGPHFRICEKLHDDYKNL